MIFQSSRHSAYLDFIVIRIVEFFCRRYISFYPHLCFFLFDHAQNFSGGCFLIVLSVFWKTGLYGSNDWKDGSWCNFFSVWRIKKEIMVSKFSIFCTKLCSNVWFVWNHTRFEILKTCEPYSGAYYGQFMIFMYAILLYGQFMTFM